MWGRLTYDTHISNSAPGSRECQTVMYCRTTTLISTIMETGLRFIISSYANGKNVMAKSFEMDSGGMCVSQQLCHYLDSTQADPVPIGHHNHQSCISHSAEQRALVKIGRQNSSQSGAKSTAVPKMIYEQQVLTIIFRSKQLCNCRWKISNLKLICRSQMSGLAKRYATIKLNMYHVILLYTTYRTIMKLNSFQKSSSYSSSSIQFIDVT